MTDRILITGAQGYIGGALVAGLATKHTPILATGRREHDGPTTPGATYRRCDLAEPNQVKTLFDHEPIGAVVHCAALIDPPAPSLSGFARDTVLATAHLIDAALRAGCRRFVLMSSISVYDGDGPFDEGSAATAATAYAWSKRAAEGLIESVAGPEVYAVALRLAGTHGRGRNAGVVWTMMKAALTGAPIVADGAQNRFRLAFIGDVVAAVRHAVQSPATVSHRVYNIAGADSCTLAELAAIIKSLTKADVPLELRSTATPRNRVMNIDRASRELGFRPEPLIAHLADMQSYVTEQLQ